MNRIDRYKILVRYVINQGIAKSQNDLGRLMGYTNASAFSQVINEKTARPKDFIAKLKSLVPNLNADWLDTGEGDMISTGSVVKQVAVDIDGDNMQIDGSITPSVVEKALETINSQQELLAEALRINREQSQAIIELLRTKL